MDVIRKTLFKYFRKVLIIISNTLNLIHLKVDNSNISYLVNIVLVNSKTRIILLLRCYYKINFVVQYSGNDHSPSCARKVVLARLPTCKSTLVLAYLLPMHVQWYLTHPHTNVKRISPPIHTRSVVFSHLHLYAYSGKQWKYF